MVASSRLKRQREDDDAPEEQQQQKVAERPPPPQELQVEPQEQQLQNMCQFGSRDLTPTPDTMPPRVWPGGKVKGDLNIPPGVQSGVG